MLDGWWRTYVASIVGVIFLLQSEVSWADCCYFYSWLSACSYATPGKAASYLRLAHAHSPCFLLVPAVRLSIYMSLYHPKANGRRWNLASYGNISKFFYEYIIIICRLLNYFDILYWGNYGILTLHYLNITRKAEADLYLIITHRWVCHKVLFATLT